MSRYNAGRFILNEELLTDIEGHTKPKVYREIAKLGFVSEWNVSYGSDIVAGYFIQFEKVSIDDFERDAVIDIDTLLDELVGYELAYVLEKFFTYEIVRRSHIVMCLLGKEF
jgi:hypothetical protein